MFRNQWVNLFVWYLIGICTVVPALVLYFIRVTTLYPLGWQDEPLSGEQATAYAMGILIVIGATDYFHSRYALKRDNYCDPRQMEFSFDSVYIDEGEYWSHLVSAWGSLVIKCLLAFGGLYTLFYFFPPVQP